MTSTLEWKSSEGLIGYQQAVDTMESRVAGIIAKTAPELVWLLEHPPLYTAGTSAKPFDLLDNNRFPVYQSGRGGQYTYHGPGQRVAYTMLDLKKRANPSQPDLRAFVKQLEQWIIATLSNFGLEAYVREGRIGVWVTDRAGQEAKIAAIGIRVRKWVTFHGISLNVSPDLSHYAGIVPCGIKNFGVTSLAAFGVDASMEDVDQQLKAEFLRIF